MADIFHDFLVKAPATKVFDAVSTPHGLDQWWTKRSSGEPKEGAEYELWFGPQYDWRAKVTKCVKDQPSSCRWRAPTSTGWELVSASTCMKRTATPASTSTTSAGPA